MRKVVMFNSVSIDGYYAGPNGESIGLYMTPKSIKPHMR